MIGIIAGTGIYDLELFDSTEKKVIKTEYGNASITVGTYKGKQIAFMTRHGETHGLLSPYINHEANIMAMHTLGVTRILASAASAGIPEEFQPGCLIVMDQFISMHTSISTYGKWSVDMTNPYCLELRKLIIQRAKELDISIFETGTYVSVDGPRYETAAEIRYFQTIGGHLVGMTGAKEATLARELGICYCPVALVTNRAAGLSNAPPDLKIHMEVMAKNSGKLKQLICETAFSLSEDHTCDCQEIAQRASASRH